MKRYEALPPNVAAALDRLGAYVMGDDGAESDLAAVEQHVVSTANTTGAVEARDDLNDIIAARAISRQAALNSLADVISKRRRRAAEEGQ